MPLRLWREPFDDLLWAFELKYDGFRALAFVERDGVRFVSRAGHVYQQFQPLALALRAELRCRTAVLDGELVGLDEHGRPDFYGLLYRRRPPSFVAFDVLAVDGRDIRVEPLKVRKRRLRTIVPSLATSILRLEPIIGDGRALYDLVCAQDLEGIVAKRLDAPYRIVEPLAWRKIKNPTYSQGVGRWEHFRRRAV
jgi:bifunctional non-homologous end joining protein LigD